MSSNFDIDISDQENTKLFKFVSWVLGLYQLGQKGRSELEDQEIYQQILTHIVDGFNADSGSLAFLTDDGEGLHLVAGIDLPPEVVGSVVSKKDSRMGAMIEDGHPALINGMAVDNNAKSKSPNVSRVSSAMCWPLRGDEGVLGALNINRKKGAQAYRDVDLEAGQIMIDLICVVLENIRLHKSDEMKIGELERMNVRMLEINKNLESAKSQLLQSEKLASIGQLAAGVAHEINNPVGYIYSNINSLQKFTDNLFRVLDAYEQVEEKIADKSLLENVKNIKNEVDMEYLNQDIRELISESQEGVTRVKKIVQDLKDFSHVDEAEWISADLHKGIDSTLNVACNEIKYKAEIVKEYGDIPHVECLASQINQVLMNLIVNATHAMDEMGTITIKTGSDSENVWISISDTGKGIPEDIRSRIFDPFFTTKEIGKCTGLGLSLAYGIIEKHQGSIKLESEVGKGSTFTVCIPIKQKKYNNDE